MPLASAALALDIVKSPFAARSQRVCVRVGDRGAYRLSVALLKDGSPLPMSGLSATLKAVLADGTYAEAACAVDDASAGLVSCTLGGAFAAVPGACREAYVEVAQGASVVGSTGSFELLVERGADLSAGQAKAYASRVDALAEMAEGLADGLAASIAASTAATASANSAATSATSARDAALVAASRADNAADDAAEAMQGITAATVLRAGNYLVGEVEGPLAHVEDAWPSPVGELRVLGESRQGSTTGKNLLSDENANALPKTTNGITFADNGDGGIRVSGTATSSAYYNYFEETTRAGISLPAGTYTVSGNIADKINIAFGRYVNGNTESLGSTATGKSKFSISEESNMRVFLSIQSGTTVNTVIYPQLELGSAATAWEPYTGGRPSPSPEYPQEIESVECGEVVACGRNLVDPDVLLQANGWTKSGDVYLGQSSYLNGPFFANGSVPCAPFELGKRYYFAADVEIVTPPTTTGNVIYLQLYCDDGSFVQGYMTSTESGVKRVEAVSLPGKTVTKACITYGQGAAIKISGLTIAEYGGSTPPLPYTGSAYPLTMPDGSPVVLRSLPDGTRDEVRWGEDGGRELVKRVGVGDASKIVVDGVNSPSVNVKSFFVYKPVSANAVFVDGAPMRNDSWAPMPEDMPGRKWDNVLDVEQTLWNATVSFGFAVAADKLATFEGATDTAKANAYIADVGGMFLYPLASPQVIPLTSSAAPRLPESTSNVWANSESGVQPDVSLAYQVDANIEHARLEDRIAALELAAIEVSPIVATSAGAGGGCSMSDAESVPVRGVEVGGAYSQSGTPSPSNPATPSFTTVSALDFSGHRVDLTEPVVLRALPDGTRDALVVGRDGVSVVRRVASVQLSVEGKYGSSAHSFMATTLKGRRPDLDSSPSRSGFLISDSMPIGYGAWVDGDGSLMVSTTGVDHPTYVYMRIPDASTVAEARSWLSDHPSHLWYALAAPATEQLPALTLPPLCAEAGTATVTAICDGPAPSIEVEYVRSLPLVIGQLSTAILEA